ncbi:bis(5'-adenosyl)-triphosphatase enpp4 isoform X4 [Gadus morhua]|uniref:bis(5'-adenosyl)-triphosphatase enpp4 isoform X4 n=1 Tax=Gadus morhua TaxID=8049 RepID=UPI0011B3DC73|nr:bis(5'-adenosyl)-triphosphatase ENPP4 isoform X4 [Gadus morhua]
MLLRMFLGSIISVTMAATNGQQEHGPPHPPPSPSSPPPPLLLVSFDGFRADYLWQYPMPNLELLYRGGVLVEELTNIFSTKTFPNHYSLVTGLYAESHGILASNMYDAAHNKTFSLAHDQDPFWWSQALPLWLTALDSNYSTAAAMWPGSDVAIGNRTATHFLPYNASMPFAERLAKVSSWLRGSEQVTEATSSPAMETLGFRRGLDRLLQAGVRVDVITTDRSPSIRKLMRETYSDIQHQFDPWHVAKGLKKKLTAAANNKKNIDLQPWLKAITNHLWWSCQSCGGDAEELKRRWKSVLHHICGIHRWEEDGQEKTCYHRDLTEEQQRRKKWLQTDSAAFQTLSDHVLNKNLLKDLNHMTLFQHTGALEVYHSAMLKYTEKRLHFAYSSMKARTLLSVMDNNKNVGRQQATTSDGTPRYNLVFPKQSKRWVARKRYEPTRQTFRKDLVERVLERRMDPTVKFADPHFYIQQPATIPDNIATTPRPDKDQSIAEHVSRFKT